MRHAFPYLLLHTYLFKKKKKKKRLILLGNFEKKVCNVALLHRLRLDCNPLFTMGFSCNVAAGLGVTKQT